MKTMWRELAKNEEDVICSFEDTHAGIILAGNFASVGSWRATLGVIVRCGIDLIKYNMFLNSNSFTLEVSVTIKALFTRETIGALYSDEMVSSLYYITGWHLTACLNGGRIKGGKKGQSDWYDHDRII